MKYIIIGAGAIGSIIAGDLVNEKGTKVVAVADLNLDFSKELVKELGPKAVAVQVDLYDEAGLRRVIKGYDVVVNAAGPFYKTARQVIQACIDEKIDYVDVADDSSAVTLLLEYDQACKDAGITALICQGVSPGTTNMLGLLGSEILDKTDEIHTNWVTSALNENSKHRNLGATYYHAIEMSSGTNPQYLDGKLVQVESATGTKEIEFGYPLGKYPVHFVGHGEPITLARAIPGVQQVTNRGNIWPIEADVANLKVFEQVGLTENSNISIKGIELNRRDIAVALLTEVFDDTEMPSNIEDIGFQVHVEVIGKKDQHNVTIVYTCFTDMNASTALSASYGAQCVAKNIQYKLKVGIVAPEEYLETKPYFQHLESKKIEILETVIIDGKKGKTVKLKV